MSLNKTNLKDRGNSINDQCVLEIDETSIILGGRKALKLGQCCIIIECENAFHFLTNFLNLNFLQGVLSQIEKLIKSKSLKKLTLAA